MYDEIAEFLDVVSGKTAPRWSFEKDKEILALIDSVGA
jgi:hypothetical protein